MEETKNNRDLYPRVDKPIFEVKRIEAEKKPKKGKNNYRGCLYSVGFKVDREISVIGLKFFGPADVDHVTYMIRVQITRTKEVWSKFSRVFQFFGMGPTYKTEELLPEILLRKVNVGKGETFLARLPHPVAILPNLWTNIQFELRGPDTECLSLCSEGVEVPIGDDLTAKFEFLTGSRQLPAFHFTSK